MCDYQFGGVIVIALALATIQDAQAQRREVTHDRATFEFLQQFSQPPTEFRGKFGTYRSPLLRDDGTKVASLAEWKVQRANLLKEWMQLLGTWPKVITDPQVTTLETTIRDGIRQLKVEFLWTPTESTIGYLLVPPGKGPFPGVVTVYYEPETAVGRGKEHRDFAWKLANRGFAALSIGTTQATADKTYALYYPSIENAEIQPLSMLAYAASNAFHVLASRPEIDSDRIGIVGHSFGGKWAMFASCLYDKFACAAWSDPGIVFDDSRSSINYWEPWYLGYHPKPWRKRGLITSDNPARGLYPMLRAEGRDLHELHALMAPRPFLVSGGSEDPIQRWQALNHTISVNQLYDEKPKVFMSNRPDHTPNDESNAVIYAFFEQFLLHK